MSIQTPFLFLQVLHPIVDALSFPFSVLRYKYIPKLVRLCCMQISNSQFATFVDEVLGIPL